MLKTLLGSIAIAVILIGGTAPERAAAQSAFRPIVVVNDSAITGYDLEQRAQILVALGFPSSNPDRVRGEAMERLIEDRLKLQEGARRGITPTQEDIDEALERLAKRASLSKQELLAGMRAQGISTQAIDDLMGADVVWGQVVRGRFARRIDPGEADIDAEIAVLQERSGRSYRISEIGLPMAGNGRTQAQTLALATQISDELNQGGDFAAAVRRHSRSPSAKKGGDIGWVPSAKLPPGVSVALSGLQPGQVTEPIQVAGGYSILRLVDVRTEASAALDPNDTELRDRISRELRNERTQRLAEGLLQELRRDALIEFR